MVEFGRKHVISGIRIGSLDVDSFKEAKGRKVQLNPRFFEKLALYRLQRRFPWLSFSPRNAPPVPLHLRRMPFEAKKIPLVKEIATCCLYRGVKMLGLCKKKGKCHGI